MGSTLRNGVAELGIKTVHEMGIDKMECYHFINCHKQRSADIKGNGYTFRGTTMSESDKWLL